MPKFEVFIPAAQASERSLTLKVDADNWMAALKAGLKRLGQGGAQVANIMVDVMEDNSIHVTEPASGRVFRIKELEEGLAFEELPAPRAQPKQALPGSDAPTPRDMPAIDLPEPPPKAAAKTERPRPPAGPAPSQRPEKAPPARPPPAPRPTPPAAAARVPPAAAAPVAATQVRPPPTPLLDATDVRAIEQLEQPVQPVTGQIGRTRSSATLEDVFADLFERTQEITGLERDRALAFLLDLALEKIPADAGSVFISDLATADLELVQARGPKAVELKRMKLRVPVGLGIVGFCAKEAVSLAISDTEKDDRFYRNVSQKIGYLTRSILCAPMVSSGRTFGCIEIINKQGTSHFSDAELAILAYVAHEGAKFLEAA